MPDIDTLEILAPLSLEELYGWADTTLSTNQAQLKRALAAAVGFCQTYTHRNFVPEGTTEEPVVKIVESDVAATTMRVPDVREISELRVDGVVVDDGYTLLPDGFGRPAPRLRLPAAPTSTVQITGTFGFLNVPADIRDAIYTDAIRRAKDKDAAFGDRVEGADGTVISYFRSLPARVQAIYSDLRVGTDFMGVG